MHRCRYCNQEINSGEAVCLGCGQHNADLDPEFLKQEARRRDRGIWLLARFGGIVLILALVSDLTGLGLVWSAIVAWGIAIMIGVVILLEKAHRSKF